MKKIDKYKIRRILFVLTGGGIGDLIVSSPIIEVLKEYFINSSVTCMINPNFVPLLEKNPYVNDFLCFGKQSGFYERLKRIKERLFDLAVIPWTTAEAAWLTYLAGIPWRVGQAGRMLYSFLFTHKVDVRTTHGDKTSHWLDCQLDYTRILEIEPSASVKPMIWLSDEEKQKGREFLAHYGIKNYDKICGLHIGKGLKIDLRCWPVDKFVEIGRLIIKETDLKLVLTGKLEEELAREFEKRIESPVMNISGKTDLRLLACVISQMSVFVCPDSGPIHMAAALGVPSVSIFALGSEVPARWHPYGTRYRIIQTKDLDCKKKCIKEKCKYFECLLAIDENEVLQAVKELLS